MRKKSGKTAALCVSVLFALAAGMTGCSADVEEIFVDTGGDILTIGIISDTQLTENYDKYAQNLEKSLEYIKARDTDVLIFAGDYGDLGTQATADRFKSVYDGVFGDDKPISLAVMGNHDYWLANFFDCWEIPFKSKMRGRLEGIFGDDYTTVKVINGYTFIALSPTDGSMEGKYDIAYAEKALDRAVQRDPDKPIFVITHQNPKGTIRGSDAWGNAELNELFSRYPNVLSISGHSHYSMLDETNVMQTEYTAIGTQSLSYTDFDPGYEPVAATADIESNPMLLYMTVKGNTVDTERIFVNTGEEYDPENRYTFVFPYDKENAAYGADRKDGAQAPVFENFFGGTTEVDGRTLITVKAAECEGLVTEYRMRFLSDGEPVKFVRNGENVEELKYFSDFFTGKNAEELSFAVPSDLPSGRYTVELRALESFGNSSATVTFGITI